MPPYKKPEQARLSLPVTGNRFLPDDSSPTHMQDHKAFFQEIESKLAKIKLEENG
jgi:hypothetical protein